jgi:hypothetical protein
MMRAFAIFAVGMLCLASIGGAEELPVNSLDASSWQVCQVAAADLSTWSAETLASAAGCIPASKCCKICDKGQACGNSCISRSYTCHKGRGCACNSSEVCG